MKLTLRKLIPGALALGLVASPTLIGPVLAESQPLVVTIVDQGSWDYTSNVSGGQSPYRYMWYDDIELWSTSAASVRISGCTLQDRGGGAAFATVLRLDITDAVGSVAQTSILLPPCIATPTPTGTPTLAPTPRPTGTPALAPTPRPTGTPTVAATPRPTGAPTLAATPRPTGTPALAPPPKSTVAATPRPTVAATAKPTTKPTVEPTAKPTVEPATPSPLASASSSTSWSWSYPSLAATPSATPSATPAVSTIVTTPPSGEQGGTFMLIALIALIALIVIVISALLVTLFWRRRRATQVKSSLT